MMFYWASVCGCGQLGVGTSGAGLREALGSPPGSPHHGTAKASSSPFPLQREYASVFATNGVTPGAAGCQWHDSCDGGRNPRPRLQHGRARYIARLLTLQHVVCSLHGTDGQAGDGECLIGGVGTLASGSHRPSCDTQPLKRCCRCTAHVPLPARPSVFHASHSGRRNTSRKSVGCSWSDSGAEPAASTARREHKRSTRATTRPQQDSPSILHCTNALMPSVSICSCVPTHIEAAKADTSALRND